MAITPVLLTPAAANTADQSSYQFGTITPLPNDPVLIVVYSSFATFPPGPNVPTITGNGITWSVIPGDGTILHSAGNRRLSVFKGASATPSTGAPTIDFAAQIQTGCAWAPIQLNGAADLGTVVVQINAEEGTNVQSLSVPLLDFADPTNNAAFGFFFHQITEGTDPGAGFTELFDVTLATPAAGFFGEWRLGEP